ncbi:phosphoadenosine phosphosulfate reductase [uncultured Aliiroseovarius sp.]|nr:phosphoadenosine phosphosulfate reductase [uncultured Aliiroseovarius sp.]
MQDDLPENDTPPKHSDISPPSWLRHLEDAGEARGYFEPLGPDHYATLTDAGRTLVVTFETMDDLRHSSPLHEPLGWKLVQENGWSNLCLLADGPTWFRDPAVYSYFDRLVEDGFFEEFEKVVFYGAGMCGYAAAAFSVVAPDVTVIAVQPQATLDPARTPFEDRFPAAMHRDFTSRYAYAPDMVEPAQDVFILLDPTIPQDVAHAALFQGDHIHRIISRHFGAKLGRAMVNMCVTQTLVDQAGSDGLTELDCYRALRLRRQHMPYLRALLSTAEARGQPHLVQCLATWVIATRRAPRFKRALRRARRVLSKTGR